MKNNVLTVDLIRLIMVEELSLLPERVNIYNQRYRIPKHDGLEVYIEYKGSPKIISSRNTTRDTGADLEEIQDVNTLEEIVIGLYSKNLEAIQLKERAVMSLYSIYSQKLQEQEGFKIYPNPVVTPVNEVEGTARLYRFDIDIRVLAWYTNVKTTEFFNSNRVVIRVNDGTPDLYEEFAIPDTDPTK